MPLCCENKHLSSLRQFQLLRGESLSRFRSSVCDFSVSKAALLLTLQTRQMYGGKNSAHLVKITNHERNGPTSGHPHAQQFEHGTPKNRAIKRGFSRWQLGTGLTKHRSPVVVVT